MSYYKIHTLSYQSVITNVRHNILISKIYSDKHYIQFQQFVNRNDKLNILCIFGIRYYMRHKLFVN